MGQIDTGSSKRRKWSPIGSQEPQKAINNSAELPKKGRSALNFWFGVSKESKSVEKSVEI